jgi:hypothetical protein
MRPLLLALALVAAAPLSALADAATSTRPAALPPVSVGDWMFVGHSDTTIMFIKSTAAPAGSLYRRVLVRFEESVPFDRRDFASMSNVETDEIDCAGHRTRVIEDTRYAERNLQGQSQHNAVDAPMWRIETKGSFGEGILRAACGEAV